MAIACEKCGNPCDTGANFCGRCGDKFAASGLKVYGAKTHRPKPTFIIPIVILAFGLVIFVAVFFNTQYQESKVKKDQELSHQPIPELEIQKFKRKAELEEESKATDLRIRIKFANDQLNLYRTRLSAIVTDNANRMKKSQEKLGKAIESAKGLIPSADIKLLSEEFKALRNVEVQCINDGESTVKDCIEITMADEKQFKSGVVGESGNVAQMDFLTRYKAIAERLKESDLKIKDYENRVDLYSKHLRTSQLPEPARPPSDIGSKNE